MIENVRLLVWDLDETFWYGTLTEGGLRIRPETCALVKELAQRGIISSICSKNGFDDVKPILEREGVWKYFVFPSINWEPKGPRIAAMIEQFQLRPATVMFLDDNPMNLQEALHFVPEIQVKSHEFIPEIADSPLFKGRDDRELARLNQYKLLETRHVAQEASGDNVDFLRRSDIRVYIERDVHAHIDRAIELINRTNQLNYTKRRLPEDLEEARRVLKTDLDGFSNQAGLIRVVDRYGDYGFVGFYLTSGSRSEVVEGAAWQRLLYYCFSCRTLGMLAEQWLYQHLRSPELRVVGEVLTDLSVPRTIDWIRLVSSLSDAAEPVTILAPEIRFYGGCEVHAIGHYLSAHTPSLSVTGNFAASGLFVRVNAASLLLSACDRVQPAFEEEAARLGLPFNTMAFDYFGGAPEGSLFIFSGGLDDAAGLIRYRHREHGWEIKVEPDGLPRIDCVRDDIDVCMRAINARNYRPEQRERIVQAVEHLRRSYISVRRGGSDVFRPMMEEVLRRVPLGSRMVVILGSERCRFPDGCVKLASWVVDYNQLMRDLIKSYPFVAALCFDDYIESDAENLGGGHYDRMVYHRIAKSLSSTVAALPVKTGAAPATAPALPYREREPAVA